MSLWSPRPRDLPDVRAATVSWWTQPDRADSFGDILHRSGTNIAPAEIANRALGALKAAELFFVADPMFDVVESAAEKVPEFPLHDGDVPAERGLLVLPRSVSAPHEPDWEPPAPVQALSWLPMVFTSGERVLVITMWSSTGELLEAAKGTPEAEGKDTSRGPHTPLWPIATEPWVFGRSWRDRATAGTADDRVPSRHYMGLLVSFFRLAGEEWVSTVLQHPDRAARRRAERAGLVEPSTIRIVTLRQAANATDADSVGGSRSGYSHRFPVTGHWRNQWYPSRQANYPKYIPTYLKGPEDKPLVIKDVVKVLRR